MTLLRTVLKGPEKRNPHYYYYVTSLTTHSSLIFVKFVKALIKDINTKSIASLNCPTTHSDLDFILVYEGPDKRTRHFYCVTGPTTHSGLYFITFVRDMIKYIG